MPKLILHILIFIISGYLHAEIDTVANDSIEIIELDTTGVEIDSSQTLVYDTTHVDVLEIPQAKIDSLIATNEYIYLTEEVRENMGLWEWFMMKFWQWFNKVYNTMGRYGLVELLGFIFAAIIVGFIIYKLAKRELSFGFVSSGEEKSEGDLVVTIKKDEFDNLIEKARNEGNRNEIIRLSFLKIISELNNQNIIRYSEDKTNRDYFYEINDDSIKTQFKKVSNIFDYTFYGEFEITDTHLNQYEPLFQNLYNSLPKGAIK